MFEPVDCTDCSNYAECGYESYEDCRCQEYGECPDYCQDCIDSCEGDSECEEDCYECDQPCGDPCDSGDEVDCNDCSNWEDCGYTEYEDCDCQVNGNCPEEEEPEP